MRLLLIIALYVFATATIMTYGKKISGPYCSIEDTNMPRCKDAPAIQNGTCYNTDGKVKCSYDYIKDSVLPKTSSLNSSMRCCSGGERSTPCERTCAYNGQSNNSICNYHLQDYTSQINSVCALDVNPGICNCYMIKVNHVRYFMEDDDPTTGTEIMIQFGLVDQIVFRDIRHINSQKRSNDDYSVQLNNGTLIIIMADIDEIVIRVSKATWELILVPTDQTTIITLPRDIFVASGSLEVNIFLNGNKTFETSFEIVGQIYCRLRDCVLCQDAWDNLNCVPPSIRFLVVGMAVLIFLLTAILVLIIVKISIWLIRSKPCCHNIKNVNKIQMVTIPESQAIITQPDEVIALDIPQGKELDSVLNSWANSNHTVTINKPKTISEQMEEALDRVDTRPRTPSRRLGPKFAGTIRGFNNSVLIMAMLCLLTPAFGCTNVPVTHSTITTCTLIDNSSTESCQAQVVITGSFPATGSELCLTITDDNGTRVGDITFKLNLVTSYAPLSLNYWTSAWLPVNECHKICPSEGGCKYNNGVAYELQQWDRINNPGACFSSRPAGDQCLLVGPSVNLPGVSNAYQLCQCITCQGCFFCDLDCVYCRTSIQSFGEAYKVMSFSSLYKVADIEITSTLGGVPKTAISAKIGSVTSIKDWRFHVDSIIESVETIFGTKKVITGGGYSYIGTAAEPNAPVARSIGDLQANSVNDLAAPGRNSYLFPFESVIAVPGSGFVAYTYPQVGLDVLSKTQAYPKLPRPFGSSTWSYQPDMVLKGIANSQPVTQFTIETAKPITFLRKINTVCPDVQLINVTGCAQCDEGVTIIVTGKTTCLEGVVSVSAGNSNWTMITTSVQLKLTPTTIHIHLLTSSTLNTGILVFCSYDKCSNITATFVAPLLQMIRNDSQTVDVTPTTFIPETPDITDALGDFLNDLPDAARWVILIVIILVSLGVVIAIVIIIVKFRHMCCCNKDYKKLSNDEVPLTTGISEN